MLVTPEGGQEEEEVLSPERPSGSLTGWARREGEEEEEEEQEEEEGLLPGGSLARRGGA